MSLANLYRCTLLSLALCGAACVSAADSRISLRDDSGQVLTLAQPARRVISLAPSLTEMLYEAGGGDRLVGAVEYSDYPPAALKIERIGNNQRLDLERIAALKPDLVLVWFHGNALREVEKLRTLGIPMFYLEPHHIADIPGTLLRIGQLLGSEAQAQQAAERFRQRHDKLRATYAGRKPLRVFYQIAEKPLMTINDQQIISDVIGLCGGINVFGKEPMLVPQISTESVVSANPDVIVSASMGSSGEQGARRAMNEPRMENWLQFGSLNAVRNRQLWMVPGDQISRHGPRILDAAQAMCTALDAARQGK
ncbi:cobalamin-binding protein [Uliginosibacterium sediminicola]|uniref:Cobalamin-binding protein n=1 Tax=Uliginosibacterium sediminicola TaxID=2024550 RepID=A0ABU9YXQ2_9RHOO